MSALQSSLLCLVTSHDAAGSGQFGITKIEGTLGDEQIGLGVPSQVAHCQICSNHVNGDATRKVVLA